MRNDTNLRSAQRRAVRRRILLAHVALVFVTAGAGALLAVVLPHTGLAGAGVVVLAAAVLAGLLIGVPAEVLLQRRILGPIRALHEAAEEIEGGDYDTRAETPAGANPNLARLAAVFNRVLDALATDRARLREVAARAMHAQEAERVRIARELQEETAQTLASMLLRLRLARQTAAPADRDALLDELRRDLMETTDAVRRYARALHPPALRDLGVGAAVEAYARTLAESSAPSVVVQGTIVRGALGADAEVALYRIVQEAVANAVRHADAARVVVRLGVEGNEVVASVEDDGRGFDVKDTEAERACLGLLGMRERALYIGGTLELDSAPGRGTRVHVRAPAATRLVQSAPAGARQEGAEAAVAAWRDARHGAEPLPLRG
jgi:two-component system sensor histidine kinase UhpB